MHKKMSNERKSWENVWRGGAVFEACFPLLSTEVIEANWINCRTQKRH